ncbi:MORN repeat-containing protein [Arsenicibacter rosenii]|uniref:Peptidase M48 domain-containing protein n=1 Tax=Arsenicibacter rosenii TaxID=1750698 RepID=A0A1S2VCJ2_9BACT|nr:hypothetical protein [Arsenicibacter rosenii]OIN56434.1 hypothetical protein BLX24_25005 [Arsenicibacter rosenii]
MRFVLFSVGLWLITQVTLLAQTGNRQSPIHQHAFVCNYTGQAGTQSLCNYMMYTASNGHAEKVVDRILKPIGLVRNFKIIECPNTRNCFATVVSGQRFIIYDGAFMQRIEDMTETDWSAISIMAHEIGHHLQGHTIDGKGGQPMKEIEADRFSGFVLHQLGASLDEALIAIKTLGAEEATTTHPAKQARIDAIRKGWTEAEEIYPQQDSNRIARNTAQRPANPLAMTNPDAPAKETTTPAKAVGKTKIGCLSGDCQDGYGIFVNPTLEKYQGDFANGSKHGEGVQFYPDGKMKYKGTFSDDVRSGNGLYFYRNGDKYVGQFQDNLPHGKGTYYFSDGDRFVGTFIKGKREGFGILYNTDGTQESGNYENDELVEEN